MNFKSKIIVIVNSILICSSTISYTQNNLNSKIENIKKLCAQKNYEQANLQIELIYKNNQNDLETIWLYAQILHWTKNDSKSEILFEKAITINPNNSVLQLDFSRMLFESGKTKKAAHKIDEFLVNNPSNFEALLMKAYLLLWNGNLIESEDIVNKIYKLAPQNEITNELKKAILDVRASKLEIKSFYQKDDQPLEAIGTNISVYSYVNNTFQPTFNATFQNFDTKNQVGSFSISNSFLLGNFGSSVIASTGVTRNFSAATEWIGGLDFKQKINKSNQLQLSFNRNIYLGTISSTYNTLMNNLLGIYFDHKNKLFSFHSEYTTRFFSDKNAIENASLWIISRPLKLSVSETSLGYGFSYSNSKNNLYVPINDFNNEIVTALYNPYFTPKNQLVHSLILNENLSFSSRFALTTKATIGLFASAENPYFYPDANGSYTLNGNVYEKEYSIVKFTPLEINSNLKYLFSKNIEINVQFNYLKTYFYNSKYVGLGLKCRL